MALVEHETLFRYFHILAGIIWIGLLYFFNLVNLPLLKFDMKKPFSVDMAEKASMHITLKTLFWFRWGAAFTFLFGLLLIGAKMEAFGAIPGGSGMDYFLGNGFAGWMILMGVIFGTIMAFNVWFIIWPAQQVIMSNNKAIAAGGDKDKLTAENGPLVKKAVFASRMNTWLSVPMLFGMVFGAHGSGDSLTAGSNGIYLAILVLLLAVMYFYSTRKTSA